MVSGNHSKQVLTAGSVSVACILFVRSVSISVLLTKTNLASLVDISILMLNV